MTTTASFVMTAAHAAARLADKMLAYRTRFTTALRAAWAATKQTAQTIMEVILPASAKDWAPNDLFNSSVAAYPDCTHEQAVAHAQAYADSKSLCAMLVVDIWFSAESGLPTITIEAENGKPGYPTYKLEKKFSSKPSREQQENATKQLEQQMIDLLNAKAVPFRFGYKRVGKPLRQSKKSTAAR